MSENDYLRDLKIDPDCLDLIWVRHPYIYMKYSEAAARANDIVRKKKNDLEILYAKLDQEVRVSFEGDGKKITEGLVKAQILSSDEYIKAQMEYNDAQYQAELCASAVKAMDHKKAALQALVQLWAGSYFAGPKNPRNIKKELDIEEQGIQSEKEEVRERARNRRINKEGDVN